MADTGTQRHLTRRQFVHALGAGAVASSVALLLAACQAPAPAAPANPGAAAGQNAAPAQSAPASSSGAAAAAPASSSGAAAAAPASNSGAAAAAPASSSGAAAAAPASSSGAAAAAQGSSSGAAAQPVRGGTLTVALSAEPVDTDPANTGGTPSMAAEQLIYNAVVRQTPDQQIRPDLALSWAAEDDKWTFKLRQGVRFHDGTPFNAAAVKYTFDRYLVNSEKVRRAGDWQPYLDSVQVIDDATVQFKTKGIDAFFLTRLANEVGIVSPTAHAKYGKDYLKSPVGTGPFKFKEWVPGVSISAVRNDDYFGDKANLDQVIMRPIPEPATRAIALQTGEVQLATPITPEQMGQVQGNAGLALVSRATSLNLMFGMNNTKKPFDDVRVRQALNYAVDRDSIVKNVYSGLAEAMQGAVPRAAIGYAPVPGYAYDPAKAKQLLADAGLASGFTATITGTNGRYFKDFELMQAVQQYLKAVGVTTNIEIVEWARYLELVRQPPNTTPMEIWLDGWNGGTAAGLFQQRWNCNAFAPNGQNVHGFCDSAIDQLLVQAGGTLDDAKRMQLLTQAQEMISLDAPSIWGVASTETTGLSKKLHNPLIFPSELVTVDEHTWLEA
jgi:ABC-type transport system substrate-binding protein